RRVHVEGGLGERMYNLFAEYVAHHEQAILAKGVLAGLLHEVPHRKLPSAWNSLRHKLGCDEDEWLPVAVARLGFPAVARLLQAEIASAHVCPHWSSRGACGTLCFGRNMARIRVQANSTETVILDEFHRRG